MGQENLYNSGCDYMFSYSKTNMTFNEEDFKERVEYAAKALGLIETALEEDEVEVLVNLVMGEEITESTSPLAHHLEVNQDALQLADNPNTSLVSWLKSLIFRGAYLDQCVLNGDLGVDFDDSTGNFSYVRPGSMERNSIELTSPPSWEHISYRPR
jgi:hypothetical protein